MSGARPPTLGELAKNCETIKVRCLDCPREAQVPIAQLALAAGLDAAFPAVAARLKCQCGSKRVHATPEWRLR